MTALRTSPVRLEEPGLPPETASPVAIGLHDLTRQLAPLQAAQAERLGYQRRGGLRLRRTG